MKQTRIAVADVVVRDRLRPTSDAGVAALVASINEVGVMKDAIHVRKHHTGEYRLLAGAHRLAAAQQLGWDEIEAKIWTDVTDDWARLIEIDDNLAGAEMNALDTAVFLATRKTIYERLHPETRRGVAGAMHKNYATDTMSVAGFVSATAEKFGLSDRHVYRMTAAATRLGPDEIQQLRIAPKPVTLADLQAISGIGEPTERQDVVRMLAVGEAKSAAAARKAWLHREHPPAPVDPVDADYLALKDRWNRTRKAAKRQFVDDAREELAGMLGDLGDAWAGISTDERRRFVAARFDDLAVLVTEESARHGDKAVYYNRALPLSERGADD